MLQVARLARKQLSDSSPLVEQFLHSQLNEDGGFKDRSGKSDLYYSAFGLEAFSALELQAPIAKVTEYLRGFGEGEELDLIHLCCLIRCWADVSRSAPPLELARLLPRIEEFRTPDGGYNTVPDSSDGTAYGCFLVMAAYQDLQQPMPRASDMLRCLASLQTPDGGYANQADLPMGLTPPSAAAAALLRHLGAEYPPGLSEWLLARCHKDGGFFATPAAPMPDLLSTATALHALSGMQVSIEAVKEPCLDFLDTLWTNTGGFYGHWADDAVDCEYTYYGLLALGHLSL